MAKLGEKIVTFCGLAAMGAILFLGFASLWPRQRQKEALMEQRRELLSRIERTEREIAELRLKQQRFKTDPKFVESLARERHRVFPGELVFVFDDTK